ncbi:MAG: fibronectin type III domain-containing protein [Elusimicrobia bacterium]|nr:fibronectin type III domain-containing protein [Elusimicrobiota bacterium]
MRNNKKVIKFVMSLVLTLMVAFAHGATVSVDYSQSLGPFKTYNQYINQTMSVKGSTDSVNVGKAGITLTHVFYSLKAVCPSEHVYTWGTLVPNTPYGNDSIVQDVINNGGEPSIMIAPAMPDWLGFYIANPLTTNAEYVVPENYAKWPNYENLIYDVLSHFKTKFPQIKYISLFEEADTLCLISNGVPSPVFYPRVWGRGAGWSVYDDGTPVDLTGGEMYKRFYLHTSSAVIKFNNDNNYNFKLIGPTPSASPPTMLAHIKQFLYFMKEMRDHNPPIPLKVDAISWDQYSDALDDSIYSIAGFAKAVNAEIVSSGFANMPLHIKEWANDVGRYLKYPTNGATLIENASYNVASWKKIMDAGLEIYPFFWALNSSLFPPNPCPMANGTNVEMPDGTVAPMYNVFKMMTMQKATRYKAECTSVFVSSGVFPLASADSGAVVLMIARCNTNENIIINLNNLPASFQSGNIHFERYLIDEMHSNFLYRLSNQNLEKVDNIYLAPGTKQFTLSTSAGWMKNDVSLIVMTPSVTTPDTTPPTITITSPINNSTVPTSLLTVSGTASDNVGLSDVELKVGAGGTYTTVNGSTTWSKSVTLASGYNVIYASATDTSGNQKGTTIAVTYTPPPDTTPPSNITTLVSGVATSNSVVLSWTSVGDDGNIGTATEYDIRYANVSINDSNWATATQCSGEPTPLVAGNNQSYTVQGLSAGITYYFAMKVRDEVPTNWSGISNIASRATMLPDTIVPADIKTLATGSATSNSIALSWTSVGDDNNIGTASVYDIRYATYSISSSNWDSAGVTQCSGVPTPQISGTLQSYTVQGLSAGITYFFVMKVADEVPNWSGISNVVSGQVNSQGNISIGKSVTVSSTESGYGNVASKAVDGNAATRWSSEYSDPQWIRIDLGGTYNINQVVLSWDTAYGKNYQLQVSSNDINWTTIYTKTAGIGGVETLSGLTGSGRYIRMYGTTRGVSIGTTLYGYSLYEFEVYGTSGTTPTKSITITYPNGGENLIAGSQQTVTWTSAGGVGNVMLQISEDGGTTWSTLVPNTPNDGSEVVTLPNSASSSCLIRLVEISGGTTDTSNSNFAITVTGQMSFGNNGNPWQIGVAISTIEAENYDAGGQNEAYYDTTPGNQGGAYRTNEDVDVEAVPGASNGYDIGYVVPGEWLEYSVNVNQAGDYKIIVGASYGDVSTASPFHIEFGPHGATNIITPSVSVPNTGGWWNFTDVTVADSVTLTQGNQIMKLVMDTGAGANNGNFDYIKIIRLSADTTPPIISNITVPTGTLTGNSVTLTWTTNELSNSKVEYGLTTSYGSATSVTDTGGVYSHSVTLSGLTENTTYHYRIVSVDMSANTTISGDYSFTTILNDSNPPLIRNITASVTQNSAIITWNTDENSDSQVAYGTTTAMGATTTLDPGMTRLHSVPLSGLQKGNTYYYIVCSRDSSGNLATSLQYNFKTYNNNIKHRIYTYYYDDGTTTTKIGASASTSLKFLVQVYNVDANSLATDYTGTLTLTTKKTNGDSLDTVDETLTAADAGEKEVTVPFRSNINTVELTGDVTAPVVINFSDMYISKLVGYQGGSIRGANGLKILIPTGVLSTNKYLAAIPTRVPPSVGNTTQYVNTRNPVCYDFGELSFSGSAESAPTLQNQVFARSVNITIPYTASDIGTLNEDGLRIYYWTGTDWTLVTGVQTVDKVNNTVTATVKHFSTYRILGSYVSADLSDIKIYPNPYNPDTAAQGKLKVINLPTNSVMKLYSVDGELVRELKELDFGNLGWLEWDGKNANGDKVARAVYIYQIEDTAGSKKTGKIGLVK